MQQERYLFWHRRDLRISNNIGLYEAYKKTSAITGIFVLDPELIKPGNNSNTISPAKLKFTINSLLELKKNWEKIGSKLFILSGNPIEIIPYFARIINANKIFWNKNLEPYETERDKEIERVLTSQNKEAHIFLDQLLIDPIELRTSANEFYKVFSPFFKNWKSKIDEIYNKQRSLFIVNQPKDLIAINYKTNFHLSEPKFKKLEKDSECCIKDLIKKCSNVGDNISICRAGEKGSKKTLSEFINNKKIHNYSNGRDIPSLNCTSHISPALNCGTLSIRDAWEASCLSLESTNSEIEIRSIQTWQKELAWREFYQNILYNFPMLSKGPYRSKWVNFPWENNISFFESWSNSQTGIPIIDAAMRELDESGWMHNRSRMIVASFLVKDLICDWRLGEKLFMSKLLDGDLAANNGGWQWSASSGMDPKPLRIFNPYTQARKFDSKANYIRKWLPEISHVNTKDLISGDISQIERRGYPEPIVNHKEQQAKFKNIYKQISN